MLSTHHHLNREIIDDLQTILGNGFAEIMAEQVEQATGYIKDLKDLLEANQSDMAMRRAHALKSSVGQIGLQGIYALAKELELACKADSESGKTSEKSLRFFRTLQEEFNPAVLHLRQYVKS